MAMTVPQIATLIVQILSVGVIIDGAETLARRSDYGENGVYSWALIRTMNRWSLSGGTSLLLDMIFSVRGFRAAMVLQIVCAAILLSQAVPSASGPVVLTLFVIRALTHIRHQYGLDGSDQMSAVILGSLTLYYFAPGHLAQELALYFIAFQAMLAYVASGSAKMTAKIWRSGRALGAILNTQSYGRKSASALLRRYPVISLVAGWAVMIFQVTFPVMVMASPITCAVALVIGISFHVSIAVTMGLNNFVWSFISAYPALWLVSTMLWAHDFGLK
jgi:hypothetical protein